MNKYTLAETTTDPKVLDELSRDKDFWVRCYVALNPNTTPETLKQMSIDEYDVEIIYFIKNRPNCSEETWRYLSALELLETLSEVST